MTRDHEQGHDVVVRDDRFGRRVVHVDVACVTGAAVVAAAGLGPVEDFVVLQHLPSGALEDIRPEEAVDQSDETPELFVIRASETFSFVVDGLSLRWPKPTIPGRGILELVRRGPEYEVVEHREEHGERVVGPDEAARLGKDGVERFETRLRRVKIIVNGRRKVVPLQPISFEAVVRLAFENPPTGDGVQFTVQYARGPEGQPTGSLVEGQTVMVREGMEFDVTSTNRS